MAKPNKDTSDTKVSPNNVDADAAFASEAGNATRDRQPATPEAARGDDQAPPDEASAASAREVRNRSDEASAHLDEAREGPDQVHPGPNRREGEKRASGKDGS